MSLASIMDTGSVSKQFTAMAIALLAEQGKLSQDDDIRKYLPEILKYESTITIRHLIHHTSGIRDYLTLMAIAGMRDDDYYVDGDVLNLLAWQKELNFKPGSEFLYSNSGYFLLSQIVKRASGKTLREYADENMFKPLGMTRTKFYDDHNEIVKNRAASYVPRKGGGFQIAATTLDMVGDGNVFTCVEDLFLRVRLALIEIQVYARYEPNIWAQPERRPRQKYQILKEKRLTGVLRLLYSIHLVLLYCLLYGRLFPMPANF
jgi:CubicO group peptidase (beta-lactamase class C family)